MAGAEPSGGGHNWTLALAGVLERVDRATEATSSNHDSRNTARCLSRLGSSTLTSMADSTAEYLAGIDQQLREIIRCVGVDRFGRRELDAMQDQASRAFDSTTNLPSVLWQSGLLGYVEQDGEAHFYSQADMDQFDIPMDADHYVFHPNMIDSVRIRGIGDPVYPFRRS